jgi:hypothetical protein
MSARSTRRRPDTLTVVKDLISFAGGWGLIGHQALLVPPADFNLSLMLLGAALVGVPGIGQLLALRTGGPSSSSPPEGSPPSPTSSPNGSGADR